MFPRICFLKAPNYLVCMYGLLGLTSAGLLVGCGGGGGSSDQSVVASLSGLTNSGLTLTVNGTSVSVAAGTQTQQLATVASGSSYSVTVTTQPTQETCTVANGSGAVPGNSGVTVSITCSVNTYSVGGSASGLTGNGLVLLNNDADPTPVKAGAAQFTLATPMTSGGAYSVTIKTQPAGETCTLGNATGSNVLANVTNVTLSCAPWSTATISILYSFTGGSDGSAPNSLLQGSDGNFYGLTAGTVNVSTGNVFKVTPAGVATTFYTFLGTVYGPPLPQGPNGLIQGADGNFYGTTFAGGSANYGTFFKIDSTGALTMLHSFAGGSDGSIPSGLVLQGADGSFYGSTGLGGGSHNNGTIFKYDPAGTESILFSMPATSGNAGYPSFLQARDGTFYDVSAAPDGGSVYAVTTAGVGTSIYTFTGGSDGATVMGLVEAADGTLFGVTGYGGLVGVGTAFKLTPAGTLTTLHTFGHGTDGSSPNSLIAGNDGNFYGTTTAGGDNTYGTLFRLTPDGQVTVLYSFGRYSQPTNLIQAADGNFYFLSSAGGTHGHGAILKVVPQ